MKHAVRSLLLSVFAVAALGCDKATPTAPGGSTLAITANPSRIGLNGSSIITIIGRQPNGSAMREGTEIRLSATLGTIDPLVLIDSSGNATAMFRSDGRTGAATITAQTGTVSGGGGGGGGAAGGGGTAGGGGGSSGPSSGSLSVQTSVQVGEVAETKPTVLISVSPNTLPVGTGRATITVIGRNADGTPVGAGQTVILTTTLGTLSDPRPRTDATGVATTTLRAGNVAGTATISAILGTSDEKTTTVTIRDAAVDISVDAQPRTITEAGDEITVTAFVTNSEGLPLQGALVRFTSPLGTFDSSTDFTDSVGQASVTLTVTSEQIDSFQEDQFNIRAETPSGSGDIISDTVTVTINRSGFF